MDFRLLLLAGSYLLVLLAATACSVQRYRSRRKPPRKSKWGYYPIAAAIAFQQLNAITHPQEKYVLQAKYDETQGEDDEGAPKDPAAHLLRQAEKIRRGESVERLTAMLGDIPDNDP